MLRTQSLALYKNKPVIVLDIRDRIEIRLEDGSISPSPGLRISSFCTKGPSKSSRKPPKAGISKRPGECSSPFRAPSCLGPSWRNWFSANQGPAQNLACWQEATKGLLFKLEDGNPIPLDDETAAKEAQKKARKESETAERAAFVERAKRIRAERKKAAAAVGAPEESASAPTTFGTGRTIPFGNRGPRLREKRKKQDVRRTRHFRDAGGRPVASHRARRLGRDDRIPTLIALFVP